MKNLNGSHLVLPLLVLITLVLVSITGYLYFTKMPQIEKIAIKSLLERKISIKPNLDEITNPAEVVITKNGFIPSTINIVAGQQITFVNQDSNMHRITPYPRVKRNNLPQLDSGELQPTDSFTYAFENIGTYIISNNIDLEKFKATVIVN